MSKDLYHLSEDVLDDDCYLISSIECKEDIEYWVYSKAEFTSANFLESSFRGSCLIERRFMDGTWRIPIKYFIPIVTKDEQFLESL